MLRNDPRPCLDPPVEPRPLLVRSMCSSSGYWRLDRAAGTKKAIWLPGGKAWCGCEGGSDRAPCVVVVMTWLSWWDMINDSQGGLWREMYSLSFYGLAFRGIPEENSRSSTTLQTLLSRLGKDRLVVHRGSRQLSDRPKQVRRDHWSLPDTAVISSRRKSRTRKSSPLLWAWAAQQILIIKLLIYIQLFIRSFLILISNFNWK